MAQHRDPVSGRWARVPTENTALAADSRFDVMRELEVKTQPETYAYGMTGRDESNADAEYDAPPVADDLGVGGSPLRPRTARLVSQAGRDVLEQHAKPDRSTLHADAMREVAGPDAGDLDPVRYLTGCIDGSE